MKNIVVLGAGTAGTMAANLMVKRKELQDWHITVIDKNDRHQYQPDFLFVPFKMMSDKRITKPRRKFLPKGVDFIEAEVTQIDREA